MWPGKGAVSRVADVGGRKGPVGNVSLASEELGSPRACTHAHTRRFLAHTYFSATAVKTHIPHGLSRDVPEEGDR